MKEPIYEKHEHERIITVNNRKVKGWLVIDSSVNGRSCGGLRISESVTLREVEDLAKGMTLKHGFIGLARGGAKAGIIAPQPSSQEMKEKLIKEFSHHIKHELDGRRYLSGPDIGSNSELIDLLYAEAGVSVPKKSTGSPNSGYFTSLSVLVGIELLARKIQKPLNKLTVAIEGFGSVGSALAVHLDKRGVRIIAISNAEGALYAEKGLPIPQLVAERSRHRDEKWIRSFTRSGVRHISHQALLTMSMDILCPCALDSCVNKNNMKKIKARVICAGANSPVTLAAERYLFKEGIIYLPDFCTNCGGILGNAMEFAGLNEKHILSVLREGMDVKLNALMVAAERTGVPTRLLAIELSMQNFNKMKNHSQKKNLVRRLKNTSLELYRRGFIPPVLIRQYVFRQFRKMFLADTVAYETVARTTTLSAPYLKFDR